MTLALAATGVPFGCFILDTTGKQVATLTFQGASTSGTAASFSADAGLGTIKINTVTGFAQATLTSDTNVVTKTPSTVACPTGYWAVDLGPGFSTCTAQGLPSELTGTMLVSQESAGYHASLNAYPGLNNNVCFHFSQQGQSVTFANSVLSFGFADNSNCPTKTNTLTATVSSDCTTAQAHITAHGCQTCIGSAVPKVSGCSGCAASAGVTAVDCDEGTYTATKQ